ncbi:MAG: hypothetical protein LBO07_02875 [Coriobacteriales bacterium]|nr:hypothetical protein [Coriobacteriales bacterium]
MGYAAKAPIEYQADELAKYLTIPESFRGLVVRLTPKDQAKHYERFADLPRYDFGKPVAELLDETRS